MKRTACFKRHQRFKGGRQSIDDDELPVRPSTSTDDPYVEKINTLDFRGSEPTKRRKKYVLSAWKNGRVAFIPKPGKESHNSLKDLRPISLTTFVLKRLKKLVERYIRDEVLLASLGQRGQYAFRAGYSVEAACHAGVGKLKKQLEQMGHAVGTLLDIESVFNSIPSESICRKALRFETPNQLLSWIGSMMHQRRLQTRRDEA
ncbi:uncharacterized protein LOC117181052 [Belonocnema kinseyi]|uniref:uncharacterized protein LOC117181052 n=1 Tax=Belonocnema kinseyi TaxID=2817044 RepID=UPI00143D7181|nr:uncharacterized protein LOC117181052 [Belonocnema kinseyi]